MSPRPPKLGVMCVTHALSTVSLRALLSFLHHQGVIPGEKKRNYYLFSLSDVPSSLSYEAGYKFHSSELNVCEYGPDQS